MGNVMTQLSSEKPAIAARIQAVVPNVAKIIHASGAPGLSFAVIHNGAIVHVEHLGHRDVSKGLKPDDSTQYSINSMTKGMVTALVGIEVHNGNLKWDSRIKNHLPAFRSTSAEVQEEATIADLLSHRTGITNFDSIWLGSQNEVLLPVDQTLATFGTLKRKLPFRTSFLYNNWGYQIVAMILEKITGLDLASLLERRLFQPLKLERTKCGWLVEDENIAMSYESLADLTPVQIGRPMIGKGVIMGAAGGVKSTIHDLIRLYATYVKSMQHQFREDVDETPGSPFKQCRNIVTARTSFAGTSIREQTYAAGFGRCQLPGPLGQFSLNPLVGNEPVAGKGDSNVIVYHHGSMPGSTSCVHLVPETASAVIVLQNSLGTNDTADFVCQAVLEALLDTQDPNDYVNIAKKFTASWILHQDKLKATLDSRQQKGTKPKPLTSYTGRYFNDIGNFCIDVLRKEGSLEMRLQGKQTETFNLEHYHNDTFSWWLPYDEIAKLGRYVTDYAAEYYLLDFAVDMDDIEHMASMSWAWDPNMPNDPEIFTRAAS